MASHVPGEVNEIEVVGVIASQCGGGGDVQVTPVHAFVHRPVAPSQVKPPSAQSTVVGVYEQTALPLVPVHVPVAPYVVDFVPLHAAGGGVVQVAPAHGVVHSPLAASQAPFAAAQSVEVAA